VKRLLGVIIFAGILAIESPGAVRGPQVLNVDQKISIDADDITLGRLFQLWDQATGMHSTVPRELTNRKLSVHFAGLSVNDALRKIFDGQPLGYVVVEGTGVVVSAQAQSGSTLEPPPAPSDNEIPMVSEEPVAPETLRMKPEIEPPPPKLIPTPFGPIVNPNGNLPPPFIQLPPVDSAPPPPFFRPEWPVIPPAGAPNGPAQNRLFGPLPIYQNAPLYAPNQR
jgi:hypothetical protein